MCIFFLDFFVCSWLLSITTLIEKGPYCQYESISGMVNFVDDHLVSSEWSSLMMRRVLRGSWKIEWVHFHFHKCYRSGERERRQGTYVILCLIESISKMWTKRERTLQERAYRCPEWEGTRSPLEILFRERNSRRCQTYNRRGILKYNFGSWVLLP